MHDSLHPPRGTLLHQCGPDSQRPVVPLARRFGPFFASGSHARERTRARPGLSKIKKKKKGKKGKHDMSGRTKIQLDAEHHATHTGRGWLMEVHVDHTG